jgi:hypothetical protein
MTLRVAGARPVSTLTRWPFLAALAMLLLNDFWLKAQFPGLVTGKLSDVAGIVMIALPLHALLPHQARAIYLGMAATFLWWKSPLSESFIAFANDVLPYTIGRVVDYSDLLALLVLPACARATRDTAREPGRLRRALTIPVAALAVFATAATSMPPAPSVDLTIRKIEADVVLDRAAAVRAIEVVMKSQRLECVDCTHRERNGTYRGRDVSVDYYFPADNAVHLRIYWFRGTFGNGEKRLAMRINQSLKDEFTARFQGLEAVEPLRGVHEAPRPPPCISEAAQAPHCTATGQPAPTKAPP